MAARKEDALKSEPQREESIAECVTRTLNLEFTPRASAAFSIGVAAIEQVMRNTFKGTWNRLTYQDAVRLLRKNIGDISEDPFKPLATALTSAGTDELVARSAIAASVREIISRNKPKKYTPPGTYVPRETLKKSSEHFKFGQIRLDN